MAKTKKKSTKKAGQAGGRQMRRSVMGTMSVLLMMTAVIVALIPVPKAQALMNADKYEEYIGNGDVIDAATVDIALGTQIPDYVQNKDNCMIYASGDGRLRVANCYDGVLGNSGVIVAYNEVSGLAGSSLDIPENMPAYRYFDSTAYAAVNEDGRFLYYMTDPDENGDYTAQLCSYDSEQIWSGRALYASDYGNGLATDASSYNLKKIYYRNTVSGNSTGDTLPFTEGVTSEQFSVRIKYIGSPEYQYNISYENNPSSLTQYHPDGDYSSIKDSPRGIFEGSSLSAVSVPQTMRVVGDRAFYNSYNLNNVTFGRGIVTIGNEAFKDCASLAAVELDGSGEGVSQLEEIGNEAFSGCSSLGSLTLPNSVRSLGNFCFYNCRRLSAVELDADGSSQLTTIGHGLFYGCEGLTQLALPAKVRLSGYSGANSPDNDVHLLFYGCDQLRDLVLPEFDRVGQTFRYDNVTGCNSLRRVTCTNNAMEFECPGSAGSMPCDSFESEEETFGPANLGAGNDDYTFPDNFYLEGNTTSSVYDYAIRHKLAFHYLNGERADQYCKLSDGYIYYANMVSDPSATLIECKPLNAANPGTNVIIPEIIGPCQINSIESSAFANPVAIEYLYIPSSINSIAANAFTQCSELRNVYFENAQGVLLGENAFKTNGSNAVVQDGGLRFFGDVDPAPDTAAGSYPKTPYSYAMTEGNTYNNPSAPTDYINYCSEFPRNLEVELEDGKPTLVSIPTYDKLKATAEAYAGLAGYVDENGNILPETFDTFKGLLKNVMDDAADLYPLSRYYSDEIGMNDGYEHSFFNEMRIAANAYNRYFIEPREDLSALKEEEQNVIRAILTPEISEGIEYLAPDLFNTKDTDGNVTSANEHMQSIVLHSVKEIPAQEFEGCSALETVQMYATPEGGETIGDSAFKDCPSLVSAVLPASTVAIGDLPFENDTALKAVSFIDAAGGTGDDGTYFGCRQGLLMELNEDNSPKELIECLELRGNVLDGFGSSSVEAAELAGLSSIRPNAFEDCKSVTGVDLSASQVGEIPEHCFLNAVNLHKVSLPETCGSLGKECFKNTAIGDVEVRNPNCNLNPTSAFTQDGGTLYNGIEYLPYVMLYGYEGSSAQYVGDSSEYPTLHFRELNDRQYTVQYYYNGEMIYSETVTHGAAASFNSATRIIMDKVGGNYVLKEWTVEPKTADLENVTTDIVATAQIEELMVEGEHRLIFKDEEGESYGSFRYFDDDVCGDFEEILKGLNGGDYPTKQSKVSGNIRTDYTYQGIDKTYTYMQGQAFKPTDPKSIEILVKFTETTEEIKADDSGDGSNQGSDDGSGGSTTPKTKYTVSFLDYNKDVFVTREVYEGDAPGEMTLKPSRSGYKFIGWSPDNYATTPVYSNTSVLSIFERDNTASGVDGDGASSGGSTSGSGSSGKKSSSSSSSSSGTSSSAKGPFTVTFVDYDGSVLSTQIVAKGQKAGNFPYVPSRKGYKFVSWSPSNYASIELTSDLIVRATYQKDPNYVAPKGSSVSGNSAKAKGSSNTRINVTKSGISNKGLASASVSGSNDNFMVKVTDSDEARSKMEQAFLNAYGSLDNLKYFAMDISLYDSTGTTKILNTNGLSVTVTLPIPDAMAGYAGNNKIATVDAAGNLERVNARLITIDNVPSVSFVAPHFSPYAFYVETDNLQANAGLSDASPKTGDPIHPKWFLAIGLALASILMFALRPSKKVVKVIA